MKKLLALCLCLLLCLSMLPSAFADKSGSCGDNLNWTLSGDTLTISGTGAMSFGSAIPPWYDNRNQIKKVVIGNGATSICFQAFLDCTSMTEISIPNSVILIDEFAFNNCAALASVTIPVSVASIESRAFYDCFSLKSILFQGKAPTIASDAFKGVTATVTYPNDSSWDSVAGKNYGGTLTWQKPANPSGACGENLNWELDKGWLIIKMRSSGGSTEMYDWNALNGNYAPWYSYRDQIEGVTINVGITHIGNFAFYNCKNLSYTNMPWTISSIGGYAFQFCESLTDINLLNGVKEIGAFAFFQAGLNGIQIIDSGVTQLYSSSFAGCPIESFSADSDNTICKSIGGVLFTKDGTKLTNYPCGRAGAYTIPDGTTMIDYRAFQYADKLSSVTIPASVTTIRNYAFFGCSLLTDVYYKGTEAQWNAIAMGSNNDSLSSATIHYSTAPTITAQPTSVTAASGTTATFTVTAAGGALSYQWQYYNTSSKTWDNVTNSAYGGLKTATMTVPATTGRNGMQFRCAVTNAQGTTYSNGATLTVK